MYSTLDALCMCIKDCVIKNMKKVLLFNCLHKWSLVTSLHNYAINLVFLLFILLFEIYVQERVLS